MHQAASSTAAAIVEKEEVCFPNLNFCPAHCLPNPLVTPLKSYLALHKEVLKALLVRLLQRVVDQHSHQDEEAGPSLPAHAVFPLRLDELNAGFGGGTPARPSEVSGVQQSQASPDCPPGTSHNGHAAMRGSRGLTLHVQRAQGHRTRT